MLKSYNIIAVGLINPTLKTSNEAELVFSIGFSVVLPCLQNIMAEKSDEIRSASAFRKHKGR